MKDANKEKYLELIKNEIVNYETTKKVKSYSINKNDLLTKYKIGKILNEAGKHYGEGIVKEYSIRLMKDFNKRYDVSYLIKMKKFYLLIKKMATVSPKLSYSHYVELLSIDNINKVKYYIKITELNNLSIRQLRERIKSNEYERLDKDTRDKLINNNDLIITDLVKNPIFIKSSLDNDEISEKVLQKLILEDISSFLKELGQGFCFIDNEYSIKIGDAYNYIDLLLFNIIYNCYVVIELKVRGLRKQDIGQIQVYMNYVDINIKTPCQDKTIGIIVCKENNELIIKYSSDPRIISIEYKLIK